MMKILLITPTLLPSSGWGRYSLAVIKELEGRKECDVSVLEIDNKASIVAFVRNVLNARCLARSADIVHALESWPHGLYGLLAVLGTNKRLFINAVGTYSFTPLKSKLKRFLLMLVYRRAHRVFSISRYTSRRLSDETNLKNIVTVHLGLNRLPQLTNQQISHYRDRFGVNSKPVILTVGAIKHRKGQFETLKSIRLLKSTYPSMAYVLVGSSDDQSYISKIRQYAASNGLEKSLYIFDDVVSDEELAFFYTIADVFVLASNNDGPSFEGFGMVLIEAASFGVPTIGSRGTGIEDAIEDRHNGYLTDQGDSQDIAGKIRQTLEGDREELTKRAKEFAGRFSWNHTVDDYVRYYIES